MTNFKITTVLDVNTNDFFFANVHSNYGLGDNWIPLTSYPITEEDMMEEIKRLKKRYNEIPCPDPELDGLDIVEHYRELRRRKRKMNNV